MSRISSSASLAVKLAFSKPCLVNLISKYTDLVSLFTSASSMCKNLEFMTTCLSDQPYKFDHRHLFYACLSDLKYYFIASDNHSNMSLLSPNLDKIRPNLVFYCYVSYFAYINSLSEAN